LYGAGLKKLLIALGGNALLNADDEQTYANQYANISIAAKHMARLISKNRGARLIITHGNGPQVGDEFLRNLYASSKIKSLPFHIINAETQSFIGSMLETALRLQLAGLGVDREIAMVLTHAIVDRNDTAFHRPTKPIGPLYTKSQLSAELKAEKFSYVNVGDKFRRVVASPAPIGILEEYSIRSLFDNGTIVIAGGGGGIPVYTDRRAGIRYANPSVIDKDLTSQLIASSVGAEQMAILTNVDYVYRDVRDHSTAIKTTDVRTLKKMMDSFGEGTMRPKVEACIDFIKRGGITAHIGKLEAIDGVVAGTSGTVITG